MTIAELIAELKKHPQEMPVMVYGHERGYHDVGKGEVKKIKRNVNLVFSYYGPHDDADTFKDSPQPREDALIL